MRQMLAVAHVLGLMAMLMSATYLLPILCGLIFSDGTLVDFASAMAINFALGYLTWLITRRFKTELRPRDGFLLVSVAWAGGAAFATLPLMLVLGDLSFTDAYFETMSGLTTTGATVLTHLDTLPESINLWRHLLNWLGGMGIIVLAVAILPLLGVGGMQVYKAETPGPLKDSKLTPRITETAKNLWLVYVGITVACIVALKLAGMNWFDAICHAFATMALGAFSTYDASIGHFDSVAIEVVLIFFMLVAAMNFATHFLAWREKSPRPYAADTEAKSMLVLILGSCIGIALYLWHSGTYDSFWTALRHASFNLVSIATDCGLHSVDYDKWPIFVPLWMLFLSCIAVSSGSTGGGIKMIRTQILARQAMREMLILIHPQIVRPMKIGGAVIPNKVVLSVLGFIFVYFMTIVSMTFALTASGLDFISAISGVIACINNAGPGLNQVGPASNFAVLSDFQTWICSLTMFLGRIEIFSLLILFTPAFWRK
jgi:trk system potassium uptake protein TrkH